MLTRNDARELLKQSGFVFHDLTDTSCKALINSIERELRVFRNRDKNAFGMRMSSRIARTENAVELFVNSDYFKQREAVTFYRSGELPAGFCGWAGDRMAEPIIYGFCHWVIDGMTSEDWSVKDGLTVTYNVEPTHSADGFQCAACGIKLGGYERFLPDDDDPHGGTWCEFENRFCPNCGLRVIDL